MKKYIFLVVLLVVVKSVSAVADDASQALFDAQKANLKAKFEKALSKKEFRKLALSATGFAANIECKGKEVSQIEACNKNVVEGLLGFAQKFAVPTAYSSSENKSFLNANLEDIYQLLNNDLFAKNVNAVKYEVAREASPVSEPSGDRLPSSAPNVTKSVEMMVNVGHYKTNFKIWESNNNQFYSYYRAPGRMVENPLSSESFSYFFKKATLVSKNNLGNTKKCPNKSISLTITDTHKTVVKGCVDSKTRVAKDLIRLANLIDVSI